MEPLTETLKGLSAEYFGPTRQADKLGVVEQRVPEAKPSVPALNATAATGIPGWQPDPKRGQTLLLEGTQHLQRRDGRKAVQCFEAAIRIDWSNSDPANLPYYLHRAQALQLLSQNEPMTSLEAYNEANKNAARGQYRAAIKSYLRSIELDPEFLWASNNLAWLLATYPEERARDGVAAVRHATAACEKSEWHCWSFIDTLSAAYAETGDFSKATMTAEKALALAPPEKRGGVEANIRRFKVKQPVRQG